MAKGRANRKESGPTVTVKVNPASKKLYQKLIDALHRAKTEGAAAFDALWESAARIVEHHPPLYVVGGYESDTAFFAGELEEKPRNAYRYIRVAKFATPAEEEAYGTTKLDAALGYLEAKLGAPLAHPPLPIAFDRLRIPIKNGTASLADARVEDIVAATRALKKTDRTPTSSAERALREGLAKHDALSAIGVRVRAGKVTFSGVPLASLGVFSTQIARAKWDTAGERASATEAGKKARKGNKAAGGKKARAKGRGNGTARGD